MTSLLYLSFGAVFGFVLSRARASDYNTMINLFRAVDFHIAGVMGMAIAVSAAGLYLIRRRGGNALIGCAVEIHSKPPQPGIFLASLVFGAGWALTGT